MPTAAPTAPAATVAAAMPEALGMPTGTAAGGTFATMLAGQPTGGSTPPSAVATPPAAAGVASAADAFNDSAATNFLQMALTSAPSIKVSSLLEKSAASIPVPVVKSADPTAPAAAVVANATTSASAMEDEPANALPQQRQPGSRRDSSGDETDDETAMQMMMATQLPVPAAAVPLALTPTLSSGAATPADTLKTPPTDRSKPSGNSKPVIATGRNRIFATQPMRATPRTSPAAPLPAASSAPIQPESALPQTATNVIPAALSTNNPPAAGGIIPNVESQPAASINPAAASVIAPQSEASVPPPEPVSSGAAEPASRPAKSTGEPVAVRPSTPLPEAEPTSPTELAPTPAPRSFPSKPTALPLTATAAAPNPISAAPVSVVTEQSSVAATPLFTAPVDASSQPVPTLPEADLPSATSRFSHASVLGNTIPPAVNPRIPVIAASETTVIAPPADAQRSSAAELVGEPVPSPLEKAAAPSSQTHRQLAGNAALRNSAPAPLAQPLPLTAEPPLPGLAMPVLSAAASLASPVSTPPPAVSAVAVAPEEPAQPSASGQQNQVTAPVVESAPALAQSNIVAAPKSAPESGFSPLIIAAQHPANTAAASTFAVENSAAPAAKITSSRSLSRPVIPVSAKTSSTGKADATLFPVDPSTEDGTVGTAIAKPESTMMTMSPAPQTKPDEALASSERSTSAAAAVAASGYGSSAQCGSTGEQSSEHQAPSGEAEPSSGFPSSFPHFAHSAAPNVEAFSKTLQAASPSTTTAMDALRHSVETLQQSGQTQVAIRLNLPGAGDVDIQLSLRGGAVHATMLTGSPELQDALRQQWSQFTSASTDPSVRLGELTVKADSNASFHQNQAQSDSQSRRQPTPEPEASLPGTVLPAFRPKPAVTTQSAAPKGSGLASWA